MEHGDMEVKKTTLYSGGTSTPTYVSTPMNSGADTSTFAINQGGVYTPMFCVPGMSADDIMDRRNIYDLGLSIGNLSGASASSGTTAPVNTTTSPTDAAKKTTNPAELLVGISESDWKKIKQMEEDIAKAKKAIEEAKEKKESSEEINKLSKELYKLKKEYDKLDRKLGKGSSLSGKFGKQNYNFYKNINPEEFGEIKDITDTISELKKELEELDKQIIEHAKEIADVKKRLGGGGGLFAPAVSDATALENMDPNKRAEIEDAKKRREELIKDIEKQIGELKSYISDKASKDGETEHFYTHAIEKEEKDRQDAASGKGVAGKASKVMFKDGKLQSKDTIINELTDGVDETKKEAIEKAVGIIYGSSTEGLEESKFKETLKGKDFFEKATGVSLEGDAGEEYAKYMVKIYDALMGEGSFKANAATHKDQKITLTAKTMHDKAYETSSSSSDGESTTSSGTTPDVKSAKAAAEKADKKADDAKKAAEKAAEAAEKETDEKKKEEASRKAKEAKEAAEKAAKEKEEEENKLKTARLNYRRKTNGKFADAVLTEENLFGEDSTKVLCHGCPTGEDREYYTVTAMNIAKGLVKIDNISDLELIVAIANGTLDLQEKNPDTGKGYFYYRDSDKSIHTANIIRRLNKFADATNHNKRLTFDWNFWGSHDIHYEDKDNHNYEIAGNQWDTNLGGACGSSEEYNMVVRLAKDLLVLINKERKELGYQTF